MKIALVVMASALDPTPVLALEQPGQPGDRAGPAEADPTCLELAQEGLLNEERAEWLCLGATSDAPFRCYAAADDDTVLDIEQRIDLCRCAQGTEPVACYVAQDRETLDSSDEIVRRCQPLTRRRLLSTCVPRRGASLIRDPYGLR